MKPNNAMSKGAYFLTHLFYMFIVYLWYNYMLFECLDGMSYEQSIFVLRLIVIISCVLCYAFTFKRNRTSSNAFINVLFSFGIYAVLSFYSILRKPITIALCIIVGITMFLGYFIFSRKIRDGADVGRIVKRRFCNWFIASRFVSAVVIVIVMVAGVVSVAINGNMILAKTEAVAVNDEMTEWSVLRKIDHLRGLQEEEWNKLDINEKIEILQVVANIDAGYLGIGHELSVGARPLENKTLGQYTYKTHTISIDTEFLINSSAKEALNVIFHETRHSYQKRTVEALDNVPEEYRSLKMYDFVYGFQTGFETYGEETPEGYAINRLEIDSRNYAKERVKMFYEEFETCLKEGK